MNLQQLIARLFVPAVLLLIFGPGCERSAKPYNCISWTVGVTDRWLWPANSMIEFDAFYAGFGYVRAADGPIAVWGQSSSTMTHGCVTGAGHGPRWESKCGGDLRIQHGLSELTGATYGRVLAFYRRNRLKEAPYERLLESLMNEKSRKSSLSSSERRRLSIQTQSIPAETQRQFEDAFEAWKQSWFEGGLAISSVPQQRSVGSEFDALVALGPSILPLLVEKLADPENFFALTLYDAIQPDEKLVVQFASGDERVLEGEQGRARRVVQAWFANK